MKKSVTLYFIFLFLFCTTICIAQNDEMGEIRKESSNIVHQYYSIDSLPINLEINELAKIQFTTNSHTKKGNIWFNIIYPQCHAVIYCSYSPTTKENINKEIMNRWQRIMLNANMEKPNSVILQDSINKYSAEMFFSPETSITPVQFMATDSISYLFSGALNFEEKITNSDSIRPIINYISEDIAYMLQNLKKNK